MIGSPGRNMIFWAPLMFVCVFEMDRSGRLKKKSDIWEGKYVHIPERHTQDLTQMRPPPPRLHEHVYVGAGRPVIPDWVRLEITMSKTHRGGKRFNQKTNYWWFLCFYLISA